MPSTMMNYPLTLVHFLERAKLLFPKVEIVSRKPDKSLHRQTYADFYRRARVGRGADQGRHEAGRPRRHAVVEPLCAS